MIERIKALVGDSQVLINEELKNYTTFRVGGPCKALILINSEDLLLKVIKLLKESNEEYFVIGNGSNLLVSDRGYEGYVLKLEGDFLDIKIDGEEITAGAGAILSKVCTFAKDKSLSGLEFAYGIPGTVGGAIVMNAGAYDGEMAFVVRKVRMLKADGSIKTYDNSEMDFSYRHSRIPGKNETVISCTLLLRAGDKSAIAGRIEELAKARREKQPLEYPSSGSTWKRPEGHFAAKLLEEAGCKGLRVGDAQISEKHAGFVINRGAATASDIRKLMRIAEDRVFETSGVRLTPEVEFIGLGAEEGDDR